MDGGAVTDKGCANLSPETLLDDSQLTINEARTRMEAIGADGRVVVYERS